MPDGYTAEVNGDTENGFIVTNTHTPEKTTISGIKIWEDSDDEGTENADGNRPTSITIRLYANGEAVKDGSGEDITATVTADGNWAFVFENLDKYADGQEIEYTITEDALYHYSTTYSTSDEDGSYIVTNTHASGKTSITVQKVWSDDSNRDGVRPESVTIDLLAGGEQAVDAQGEEIKMTLNGDGVDAGTETVYTSDPIELSDSNSWTETVSDLYKYANGGKEITYSVSESTVPEGYDVSVEWDEVSESYKMTNIHTPEMISISGEKVWDDDNDRYDMRPNEITVSLFNGDTQVAEQIVTASDNWKFEFTDLPKYEDHGTEIQYTVKEDVVKDYATNIQDNDDGTWTISYG